MADRATAGEDHDGGETTGDGLYDDGVALKCLNDGRMFVEGLNQGGP